MKHQKIVKASDLPNYTTYRDNYHHSDDWADILIETWIAVLKEFKADGDWTPERFRETLCEKIIGRCSLEEDFLQACSDTGIQGDLDSQLFEDYTTAQMKQAYDLVPSNLYGEFCWIPDWNDRDLDDLMYTNGINSERCRSTAIEHVKPGKWLEVFLKLVNCSSIDLIGKAIDNQADAGHSLAEKCAAVNFYVERNPNRKPLMNADEVITAIENGYRGALPTVHFEINIRALYELSPLKPIHITSKKGMVHIGFHEFLNGAGYMDQYAGEIVIPAGVTDFAGRNRWSYGINEVYGIYRPAFFAEPKSVLDNSQAT